MKSFISIFSKIFLLIFMIGVTFKINLTREASVQSSFCFEFDLNKIRLSLSKCFRDPLLNVQDMNFLLKLNKEIEKQDWTIHNIWVLAESSNMIGIEIVNHDKTKFEYLTCDSFMGLQGAFASDITDWKKRGRIILRSD